MSDIERVLEEIKEQGAVSPINQATLARMAAVCRAAAAEHGGKHYEPECPICLALDALPGEGE